MLREIYEPYPDLGSRTVPFAILDPLREPAAQIKKLRELRARFPFYGLKIQATVIQSDVGALLREGRGFVARASKRPDTSGPWHQPKLANPTAMWHRSTKQS